MTTAAPTWRCPRCETVAFEGQRFCRQCGHQHDDGTGEIAVPPAIRPVSRFLIALIVVLFAVLGALAAILVDDIRDDSSGQPSPGSGTRPITSTDWPNGGDTFDSTHLATGTTVLS